MRQRADAVAGGVRVGAPRGVLSWIFGPRHASRLLLGTARGGDLSGGSEQRRAVMASITHIRSRQGGLTLERAILVALALHVLFALAISRWPGLLVPARNVAPPPPLRFHFVESPAEPVQTPPPTEVLSDRDRLASDRSPRDDAAQPLVRGNTDQMVLGAAPSASVPAGGEPSAASAPAPATTPAEPRPSEQPAPTETKPEPARPDAVRPQPERTTPATEAQPENRPLPPRRSRLRGQLARLESLVDPQVFDNATGGAPDRGSLAQFDTRGYDLGPYLQKVLETIKRNWYANIPPLIRTGVQGATFVALTIRRERRPDGEEVAVIVPEQTWSSSQPAYDSAALFALELSTPLPPIPEFYPYDTITGRLGFLYNIRDTREVRFPEQ